MHPFTRFLAGVFTGLLPISYAAADSYFVGNLNGAQEVPPNASAATGFGRVTLNDAQTSIRVSLDFSGLAAGASAAHIHGPALPGANASPIFTIVVPAAAAGTGAPQTFSVSAAQAAQLRAGLWYFNIHDSVFPGGEIRGQILADKPFLSTLVGAQEVPPVSSTGLGFAAISLNTAGDRLVVSTRFAGLVGTTTLGHIHGPGLPGVNAPAIFDLSPPLGVRFGEITEQFHTVTPTQRDQLRAGQFYLNLHTSVAGGGEVRGQAWPYEKTFTFGAAMTGGQENPPVATAARGFVVVTVAPTESAINVSYDFENLSSNASAAHLHGPAPLGFNASPVVSLAPPAATSGSQFNVASAITVGQLAELRAGRWYLNVHSANFGGGEIRGQLFPLWGQVAQLDSTQESTPTTDTGLGLGTVLMAPSNDRLFSQLAFNVSTGNSTGAHIHTGAVGVNGPVTFNLLPPALPAWVSGDQIFTPSAQNVADLRAGLFYYNVHTGTFPGGAIRGQVRPADFVLTSGFD